MAVALNTFWITLGVLIVSSSCQLQNSFRILDNNVEINNNSPSSTGANLPRNCQRGKAYKIIDGSDLSLKSAEPELGCVYEAGLTPSKVPEGPLYGSVINVLHTNVFDPFVNRIWWGKIATEYTCPDTGSMVHLGFNNMLNHFLQPFLVYLGHLDGNDKGSLILDYTVDFSQICPGLEKAAGVRKNLFPGNTFVDGVRFVGRQRDGGAILLGKVVHQQDKSLVVSYFSFVNYDAQLNSDFAVGQTLPPL